MASNFISTYNLLQGPRIHARTAQAEIARLGKEIVEGRHADAGLVLGVRTGQSTILYRELARIDNFTTSNGLIAGRLDVTQATLTSIRSAGEKTLATLVGLPTNDLGAAALRGEGQRELKALAEQLNSAYAGQQLFSGIKTDTPPITLEKGAAQVNTAFDNFFKAFQTYWNDTHPVGTPAATVGDIGAEELGLFLNPKDPASFAAGPLRDLAQAIWGTAAGTIAVNTAASGTDGPPATPPALMQDFGNADLSFGGSITLAVGGTHAGNSGTITFTDADDLRSQLLALSGVASVSFGTGADANKLTIVGAATGSAQTLNITAVADLMTQDASGPARFDHEFSDGKWTQNWSSASASTISNRISSSETVESSVSANAAAFRGLARAYSALGMLPTDQLSEGALKQVVSYASAEFGKATNDLTISQADLSQAQTRIKTVNENLSTQKTLLRSNLVDLEGVDPADAKVSLDAAELQLSLSYALTARLQKLSLLNYIS